MFIFFCAPISLKNDFTSEKKTFKFPKRKRKMNLLIATRITLSLNCIKFEYHNVMNCYSY